MNTNCDEQITQTNNDISKHFCLSQNPLVRDGVSQLQRLLNTLLPTYVSVDERSMKDLVEFVQNLGQEINYLEFDGTAVTKDTWDIFFSLTDENWEDFDLEEYIKELKVTGESSPHLALFFGFLYMFKVAQDDLNTITKRHLDFYYREVLQLVENPAVPDQAAIIFKLAKNASTHLIKKGTKLKGGKDDLGVELIYEVQRDIVVNKAIIADKKALFANMHNRLVDDTPGLENDHRLYVSSIANSSDGEGGKIENEERSWRTFGEPQFTEDGGVFITDRKQPAIGFAFASPILFLAEGTRNIKIEITFASSLPTIGLDHDHFIVQLSGEEEWISGNVANIGEVDEDKTTIDATKLIIQRTINPDQPAVVAYNQEILLQPFNTHWPVIKVKLNSEKVHDPFIYKSFKDLSPSSVTITTDVDDVLDLTLQNDQAVIDPSKPFLPFGNRPYVGSKFYIGSWEVFQKKLKELQVKFKWNDLPTGNFSDHYTNYEMSTDFQINIIWDDLVFSLAPENSPEAAPAEVPFAESAPLFSATIASPTPVPSTIHKNESFKIDVDILDEKIWKELSEGNIELFTDENGDKILDGNDLPGPEANKSMLNFTEINSGIEEPSRNEDLLKGDEWNVNSKKGFIRMTLQGVDFGHTDFANAYARQAIELSKESPSDWAQLPNPPYTPSIQELSLSYISEVSYDFDNEKPSEENTEQFFHIEPFGVKEITNKTTETILPQFLHEGSLYIGIKDLVPPQTLSMLFQVAEGSANPIRNTQTIEWSVLSENEWIAFNDKTVLSDSTNNLLSSGIISFAIPEEASKLNTLLPSGSFWLKASVAEESDAISKFIDIRAQAVLAQFADNSNDPDHLRIALEAESISKLLSSNSSIDSLEQPYSSFGGKVKEESRDFYTRVSERLRHKHRAIAIWDYEHIALQQFPSVYKAKCINHTYFSGTLEEYSEMKPGHVTLIVVSNVQNKNAVDPLRPMTSLSMLQEIREYIEDLNPMCAELHVKNPIYEEIKVEFEVKFLADDIGFYQNKLEQEIKEFLSPWSSDCAADISFGGKIHKSVILNFVEERSYVDYVTCFKMYHIVPLDPENNPDKDIDEATATTAVSILGSADSHDITPIPVGVEDCTCPENEIKTTEQIASADDCPCHEEITSLDKETLDAEINLDLT